MSTTAPVPVDQIVANGNGSSSTAAAAAREDRLDRRIADAIREGAARAVVAIGLGGVIVIHAVDGVDKWSETRYMFWMYMAAIAGALVAGAWTLFSRSRLSLLAAAGVAGSVLAGFVVDRTVGMPNATGDIGNWTEALGLVSMIVEGLTVAVALAAFRMTGAARRSAR